MIPSVVIKGFLRWQRGYNIFAEAKPEIPSRHRQLTWPIRTQDLFHLAHMQNLRIIIFLYPLGAGPNNVYPRESWRCIVNIFFFTVGSFCAACPNFFYFIFIFIYFFIFYYFYFFLPQLFKGE